MVHLWTRGRCTFHAVLTTGSASGGAGGCCRALRGGVVFEGQFDDQVGRAIRIQAREQRHRHVVDRDAGGRAPFGAAAMRVAMEHRVDAISVDGLLEPARAEIRKDFRRLAFDGGANRRVVQHGDAACRAQARQRGLELQRLVDRFLDEALDRPLAPGPERAAAEAAAEPFDAREPDAVDLGGFAVEDRHAGIGQNLADLVLVAAFIVVVAEHGDDGNVDRRRQLAGEDARLFRKSVVGKIPAQDQDVGRLADLREELMKDALRAFRHVNVADRGNAQVGPRQGRPFCHRFLSIRRRTMTPV